MYKNKGFTLIELLVVIAIIGVLSTIVLSALNNSRLKGKDAKTKSQLSGLRAAAELYYENGKHYGPASINVCNSGMFLNQLVGAYVNNLNTDPDITLGCRVIGPPAEPSYAVYANLLSTTGYWCVDSLGSSKQIANTLANGDTTCD